MGVSIGNIMTLAALGAVGLVIFGVIFGPVLMLASKLILGKTVAFGQAFLIVVAAVLVSAAITWPVHAGIGNVAEGQTLAHFIMGWAISFGVMTALIDKATNAGLTKSALVAILNFVLYMIVWMAAAVAIIGFVSTFMGGALKGVGG